MSTKFTAEGTGRADSPDGFETEEKQKPERGQAKPAQGGSHGCLSSSGNPGEEEEEDLDDHKEDAMLKMSTMPVLRPPGIWGFSVAGGKDSDVDYVC